MPAPLAQGTLKAPTGGVDWHYVYRVYCRCDDLLYVGLTQDVLVRVGAGHLSRAARHPWTRHRWDRVEWEAHQGRDAAAREEVRQIRALNPLYNLADAYRAVRWRDLPDPIFLTADETHWQTILMGARGASVTEFLAWVEDNRAA